MNNDDDKPARDWETWKRDRAADRRRAAIERQAQSAAEFMTTAGPEEIARLICRPYTPRKALKKSEWDSSQICRR